jgi:hypothetical protein
MTAQLTWLEAARLNVGDRVVFVDAHDIFPATLVPAGTRATVTEQGLNGIMSALAVKPDDAELQAKLAEWDGEIMLAGRAAGQGQPLSRRPLHRGGAAALA